MSAPQMQPVKSSNIARVGYDPDTKEMHVEFQNGGAYVYHDVSPEEHAALMSAKSMGSHLHNFFVRTGNKVTKK